MMCTDNLSIVSALRQESGGGGHWVLKNSSKGNRVHKLVKKGLPGAMLCQIGVESALLGTK